MNPLLLINMEATNVDKQDSKKERKKRTPKAPESKKERKKRAPKEHIEPTCLEECTSLNTPKATLTGTFRAKVLSVYDGDTLTVAIDINGFKKYNCRMNRYDSPERKSKNPEEKKWANVSKTLLTNLVLGKIVTIIISNNDDKYGRLLVDMVIEGENGEINVNEYMLTHGYCVAYGGATKELWDFSTWDKSRLTPDLLALFN
jgi:micrococcal nuclease